MEVATMTTLAKAGAAAAFGLAAFGSALGIGAAGMAAVGAWKKSYAQNKPASFVLLAFVGAPMSQTIYGMILMNQMLAAIAQSSANWAAFIGAGIFGGLAIGASSWWQGIAGAAGADALSETGKGFGNYLMVMGVVETIALFVLIFIASTFR